MQTKITVAARVAVILIITTVCPKFHAALSPIVDISNALRKALDDNKNHAIEVRQASQVDENKPSFLTRLVANARRLFCHNSSSIEVVDDYFDDIPNHNNDKSPKQGKPTQREAQYLKTSLKNDGSFNNFGNEQKDAELTEKNPVEQNIELSI